MRFVHIFTLSLLIFQIGLAQNPEGKFVYNAEFIKFENQNVEFDIGDNGCLISRIRGSGTFEILNNYLLINTSDYFGQKSFYKSDSTSNDSIILRIKDIARKVIPFVYIQFLNSKNKVIGGINVGKTGITTLPKKMNINKFKVTYVGYDPYIFDYKPYSNIEVTLEEGFIIERKTVAFRICSITLCTLELKLLTTDFRKNGNTLKSLQKLEKNPCDQSVKTFKK